MTSTYHSIVAIALCPLLAAACSSDAEDAFGSGASDGAGAGTGDGAGFAQGSGSAQGGSGGFDACVATGAKAEAKKAPADIIWAVDTSASMIEESAEVQANMNAFATIIAQSGIDARVILISDKGQGQNSGPPQPYEICIPAPLGNGAQPDGFCDGTDEKLPGYRHVVESVTSNDALDVVISTYPDYQAQLRPDAVKVVAVVSDDESAMSASEFVTAMAALDPSFEGMIFDSIVANQGPDECLAACQGSCGTCGACCGGCNPISAAEGAIYKELSQSTGGTFGDLCSQDFDPVFADMAAGVIIGAQVPCNFTIPSPPEGETLDPDMVNVAYKPGGVDPSTKVLRVQTAADCGPGGGWYYDDNANPAAILLCPATCSTVSADTSAQVDVLFGCASELAPPS